jgi:aspartate/methionine/tyrosine aminotransferase
VASAQVQRAVEEALDRGETHYSDRPGILPLRLAVADYLSRRFGFDANPNSDVIVTCGVTEARFIATQQIFKPGETVYAPVMSQRIAGAAIFRRLEVSARAASVDGLYLTSSSSEAAMRGQIDSVPESAFIIYEVDEEISVFHPAQLPNCEQRTVTIGNLGAESWRVGYLVTPVFSSGLRDFKQALTICTTSLSQFAVVAEMAE